MRSAAALAAACLVAGCTVLEPIGEFPVESGDVVRITTSGGERYDLVVTGVDGETMDGETPTGAVVAIPVGEIVEVQRRRSSETRTTAAAFLGVPLLIGAVGSLILLLVSI